MMSVFATSTQAPFSAIIEAAKGFSQPKKRRHELWAATCYFRPDALRELISALINHINLTDVYVVYNYAEDFRYPTLAMEIRKLVNSYAKRNVNVEFRQLKAETGLFHSKGYALIQWDGTNDTARETYLLITSGNLTSQGLGIVEGSSNFELSYGSSTKKDAKAFMDILNDVWEGLYVGELEIARGLAKNDAELRMRVLLEATYLCKWDGSLRRELSAIFKVADNSIALVAETNPRLLELDFNIDTHTLSRYYFDDRPSRPFPKYFLKYYTAKTLIGNWCPSSVWTIVQRACSDEFSEFDEWLKSETSDEKLNDVAAKCGNDLAALKEIGIEITEDPMEVLQKRAVKLRDNDVKKRRLYWGYEGFPLPYDLENIDGLTALYDSLAETAMSIGKKNIVSRKLNAAIESLDFGQMALSEAECDRLLADFAGGADANHQDGDDGEE